MLLTPSLTRIQVRVVDLVLDLTNRLGQVTEPDELKIKFLPNGCCTIQLLLKTTRHLLQPDGILGDLAPAGYAPAPDVLLLATGDCAVDPDGAPRYRKITDTLPATANRAEVLGTALKVLTNQVETFAAGQDWLAYLAAKPEALLTQDRFFGIVCAHESITIWDLVELYIHQADAPPSRFAAG